MARYQQDLKRDDFLFDPSQEMAVKKLQSLYERLVQGRPAKGREKESGLGLKRLIKLKGKFRKNTAVEPEKGLYFWGGVGRGKTYLMDNFFESLPFEKKMRVHFHRFMQRIHQDLRKLQGTPNPLDVVADRISKEARVICFDEFFVSDIGDAMILARMLEALFSRGVALVCTSNIIPDGLYKDGLQRSRFIPAIELLNKYTEVVNVDGGTDFRLRTLEQAELFHHPLCEKTAQLMQSCFSSLSMAGGEQGQNVEINSRILKAIKRSGNVAWFDFAVLCDGPRSSEDYIELAKEFHAVLLSNVPILNEEMTDQARRFINMVDEFYDRSVKMVISADAPIHQLYTGKKLAFEFERTESRLLEMQSQTYLEAPHLP
jgi:cell division protein ZapE